MDEVTSLEAASIVARDRLRRDYGGMASDDNDCMDAGDYTSMMDGAVMFYLYDGSLKPLPVTGATGTATLRGTVQYRRT